MGKTTDAGAKADDGTPALGDIKAMFDLLARVRNAEQRARLLACAAIAFDIEDDVIAKLRRTR